MKDSFNNMPQNAKTWVYAANRVLTSAESTAIKAGAQQFMNSWTAHENKVMASFGIIDHVFLVLMVDERSHEISGCGIDKSVAFFKEINKRYNLDLFNRMQIELRIGGELIMTNKTGVQNRLKSGTVNGQTITFNKMVASKQAFDTEFEISLDKSWFYSAVKIPLLTD